MAELARLPGSPITGCAKDAGRVFPQLQKLRGIADLLVALSEPRRETRLPSAPTIGLEFLGLEMGVTLDALEQELDGLPVAAGAAHER